MNVNKNDYKRYTEAHAKRSPLLKNCSLAFIIGGAICALAELISTAYSKMSFIPSSKTSTLTSVTLIFIAVCLTGFGIYDKLARVAGAGTLVPITGFANAVAAPAIDARAEGMILGVGAKIFTVSGPVILYGTLAGFIYGVIYWICKLF